MTRPAGALSSELPPARFDERVDQRQRVSKEAKISERHTDEMLDAFVVVRNRRHFLQLLSRENKRRMKKEEKRDGAKSRGFLNFILAAPQIRRPLNSLGRARFWCILLTVAAARSVSDDIGAAVMVMLELLTPTAACSR